MNREIFAEIKNQLPNFQLVDYFRSLNFLLSRKETKQLKPLRIFVLRSYTAELLEPILKLRLMLEGYNSEFFWGGFNRFSQEILEHSSQLYISKPNLILWLLQIDDLLPAFIHTFASKKNDHRYWKGKLNFVLKQINKLLAKINAQMPTQVILQNIDLKASPYLGIYDSQKAYNQMSLVREFNQKLNALSEKYANTFIWNFADFISKKGTENIYDAKQWYTSSNPFKQTSYIEIADDLLRYILSAFGVIKKCIVVDLDNTLWGGIIGEDGLEGIKLAYDYPGNCYMDLQRELLKLYHRGILLAINSKNNEADALTAIDNHPNMILKRKHFAAYRINWNDKVSNLLSLAQELNIGIDSMIFIDDDPAECELVKKYYPQCCVVQLKGMPYQITAIVRNLPKIENIKLTDEDRKKGELYQAQLKRKKFAASTTDLADFLRSLKMQIAIKPNDQFSLSRISQLTQRTNQFNLTTKRYSEADIIRLTNSKNHFVFGVAAKDRFGGHGIVGVFILYIEKKNAYIDTFLLSCRVMERTIERSMVAFMAEFAKSKGATKLIGEFIPTNRNNPAKDVYTKLGFSNISKNKFMADLRRKKFDHSPYIKIIN